MHIFQIAIVEDNVKDRKWITSMLVTYLESHHLPYHLHEFACGEDFLNSLPDVWYDIVFMDIYMGGISGVEASRVLRAGQPDCKLVFLTISEDFMREGFSLNSSHYLVKPVEEKDFLQAMENCRIRRVCEVPQLSITSNRVSICINTTDILYIDIDNRIVNIHTKKEVLSCGRNFKKVTDPLTFDRRFLSCNKGLLVNMDYIAALDKSCFLLTNGTRLPISLRRKKEISSLYHKYVFGTL